MSASSSIRASSVAVLRGCRRRGHGQQEREEQRRGPSGDSWGCGHAARIIEQMARMCITDHDWVDRSWTASVDRSWTEPTRNLPSSWTSHLPRPAPAAYRRYQPGGVIETEPERLVRQSLGQPRRRLSRALSCLPLRSARDTVAGTALHRDARRSTATVTSPRRRTHDGHHHLPLVRGGLTCSPFAELEEPEASFTCPDCGTTVDFVEEPSRPRPAPA